MNKKDSDKQTLIKRIFKFIGVGLTCTLTDFLVYSFSLSVVFGGNNDFVTASAVISGTIATIVAFILHSKITWKNRSPGKYGVVKFFAWNAFSVAVLRPILTTIFGLLTGLYQLAFAIFSGIGFTYDFVESTGIYILMTVVVMVTNYLFYDKIVFGSNQKQRKNVEVKRVRQSGKEEKSNAKRGDSRK